MVLLPTHTVMSSKLSIVKLLLHFSFPGNFGDRYFGTEPDLHQVELILPPSDNPETCLGTQSTQGYLDRSISTPCGVIQAL